MYRARAVYSIPTTPISTPVSVCVHHIRLVSVKEETPPVLREIFFFFFSEELLVRSRYRGAGSLE